MYICHAPLSCLYHGVCVLFWRVLYQCGPSAFFVGFSLSHLSTKIPSCHKAVLYCRRVVVPNTSCKLSLEWKRPFGTRRVNFAY